MSELIGGRYRVDALLGSGAFATVHLAHDEQLDDPVAVKILAHNHAVNPDIRSRFILEGQTLRRLSSPHLVSVHDLSTTDDGRPFLVLELCDRGTLRDRAEQARTAGWTPTEADVVTIATALADAIGTLADADVVHRDLTPANVLLTSRGKPLPTGDPRSTLIPADERLVVTDLGFCKDLAASSGISAAGGTAGFQPPEQSLIGGVVDVRSDLWAASAVLTWVLCGTTATNPADAVAGITAAGLSQPVAAAISNGLHHDPSRRPPTAAAWLDGITQAASQVTPDPPAVRDHPIGGPPPDRWSRPTARSVLAIVAVLAGMFVLLLLAHRLGSSVGNALAGDEVPLAASDTRPDPTGAEPADSDPAASTALNSTAMPTVPPPPSGPLPGFEQRHGGQWAFHLTTYQDWEYDVDVQVDTAYAWGQVIEDDLPPGLAKVTLAIDGTAEFQTTSTITDRDAPDLGDTTFIAQFGNDFLDYKVGLPGPCDAVGYGPLGWIEAIGPHDDDEATGGFHCTLNTRLRAPDHFTAGRSTPQERLEEFLALMDGRDPEFYVMEFADLVCSLWLLPNGTVAAEGKSSCQISGDAVIDIDDV